MQYENPQLPEGVNYSHEHPLRELAVLLGGALVIVVAAVFALALAAGWLARQVPFETEQGWAASVAAGMPAADLTPAETAAVARLQAMVDRIAQLQALPAGMRPVVHLMDGDEVNAFATIGGHLFVTRGILAEMPHENALVTVLAHEVAHVKHRDPVVALGRGVAVMAALGALAGVGDVVANQLGNAGLLTSLKFSRDQERAADEEALRTLQGWYGHTAGAADLFEVLKKAAAGHEPPAFMSTHPATDERIARMREAGRTGALQPLPTEIAALRQE